MAANHGGEARDEEKIPVGHEMDHAPRGGKQSQARIRTAFGTLTVVQGEKERVLIELDVFEAFKSQRPPVEQGQERAAQVPGSGLSSEMRQRTAPNFPTDGTPGRTGDAGWGDGESTGRLSLVRRGRKVSPDRLPGPEVRLYPLPPLGRAAPRRIRCNTSAGYKTHRWTLRRWRD